MLQIVQITSYFLQRDMLDSLDDRSHKLLYIQQKGKQIYNAQHTSGKTVCLWTKCKKKTWEPIQQWGEMHYGIWHRMKQLSNQNVSVSMDVEFYVHGVSKQATEIEPRTYQLDGWMVEFYTPLLNSVGLVSRILLLRCRKGVSLGLWLIITILCSMQSCS